MNRRRTRQPQLHSLYFAFGRFYAVLHSSSLHLFDAALLFFSLLCSACPRSEFSIAIDLRLATRKPSWIDRRPSILSYCQINSNEGNNFNLNSRSVGIV
jgi:hypothetical protein